MTKSHFKAMTTLIPKSVLTILQEHGYELVLASSMLPLEGKTSGFLTHDCWYARSISATASDDQFMTQFNATASKTHQTHEGPHRQTSLLLCQGFVQGIEVLQPAESRLRVAVRCGAWCSISGLRPSVDTDTHLVLARSLREASAPNAADL